MKAPCRGAPRGRSAPRGFTLVELAMMLLIVGLVLGSMLFTLSAQVEQSNRSETLRRLESAKELLLAFAIVNGRLPCPASAVSNGDESPTGGDICSSYYNGFLPATAIGFQPVDASGYAVDAWGNRIRYAVSQTQWGTTPFARYTKRHVAGATTSAWSLGQTPNDLLICATTQAGPACTAGTAVTNQNITVAVVFSTGKNGSSGPQGANETENVDGDAVFVSRAPDAAGALGGEFDDLLVWLTAGALYGRMISAGTLP